MTYKRFTGWLLVLILLFPAWAGATPFTKVVIIGDSLSDQGNVSIITGGAIPPPEYTDGTTSGRFTNGRNYIDYLGQELGLDINPSLLPGGTNYAYGGARTDSHALSMFGAKNLLEQRDAFIADLGVEPADPDALYIVWAGSNNLQDIILGNPSTGLEKAVTDLVGVVGSIVDKGAVDIIVPNIPDLGIVPLVTGGGPRVDAASMLTAGFNSALDQALEAVLQLYPNTNLMRFDSFGLLGEAFTNPDLFGFNNVNEPCYSEFVEPGGDICSSPDDYLSWDGFHPTTAGHRIIADRMLALVSVPEPGSLALLILGFAGLGLSRILVRSSS